MVNRDNAAVLEHRLAILEAIRAATVASDDQFNSLFFGPHAWSAVRYPAVQVDPQEASYQGSHEYQHTIETALVYRWQDSTDYLEDVLPPTFDYLSAVMAELEATPAVTNYLPAQVSDFAGEVEGQRLTALVVTWQVTTLSDLAVSSDQ
jgi:hypothetical protein